MANFEYQETTITNKHFIHTEMQIKVQNCLLPFRSMLFKYIGGFVQFFHYVCLYVYGEVNKG